MDNLLSGIKNGDKRAIRELFLSFYNHCKWAILNNEGIDEDAKEVFQQAILSLMEKLQEGKLEVDNLQAYLYNTCKFIWFKRKRRLVTHTDDFKENYEETNISELNDYLESRKYLMYEGLNQLGEACRKLLELFYFEKLSDKEIAPILDYKLGFVRVKRGRCVEGLRKKIETLASKVL